MWNRSLKTGTPVVCARGYEGGMWQDVVVRSDLSAHIPKETGGVPRRALLHAGVMGHLPPKGGTMREEALDARKTWGYVGGQKSKPATSLARRAKSSTTSGNHPSPRLLPHVLSKTSPESAVWGMQLLRGGRAADVPSGWGRLWEGDVRVVWTQGLRLPSPAAHSLCHCPTIRRACMHTGVTSLSRLHPLVKVAPKFQKIRVPKVV